MCHCEILFPVNVTWISKFPFILAALPLLILSPMDAVLTGVFVNRIDLVMFDEGSGQEWSARGIESQHNPLIVWVIDFKRTQVLYVNSSWNIASISIVKYDIYYLGLSLKRVN